MDVGGNSSLWGKCMELGDEPDDLGWINDESAEVAFGRLTGAV